jgi:hypothetical protein
LYELKIEFQQNQVNLEALYGKAKTKDAETYIRIIESKDWILGHPEIECLAKIANIEIAIHSKEYDSLTGCKMVHTYNKDAPRGNIIIFRTVEGSVAKVLSKINEKAEIVYPTAMMNGPSATAMAGTRATVSEGEAELVIPAELSKTKSKKITERQVYNPAESVPIEVTGGTSSIEKAEGSSFGRCKLVATQEALTESEFHEIAEVTQDSTVNGFLDFSPEDTDDIITAIAEGTAPRLNIDSVYSEKKVKSVQMESEELKEVASLILQGGPKAEEVRSPYVIRRPLMLLDFFLRTIFNSSLVLFTIIFCFVSFFPRQMNKKPYPCSNVLVITSLGRN